MNQHARPFLWKPGHGPDGAVIERLQKHSPRPREPMGEAWFMGEKREMFDYLLRGDLSGLELSQLSRPLEEVASGNSCFGPMREWHEWLLFLLPRLIVESMSPHRRRLQELLVSAVMSEYWDVTQPGPYREFHSDLLHSLGQVIMDRSKWSNGSPILGRVLHAPSDASNAPWGWWEASGDLSSSLFFCLKYLGPERIGAWVRSVVAIEDPHWMAQLLVWLEGAQSLLRTPGLQPKDVFMREPRVDWESSHVLDGNYGADRSPSVLKSPLLPSANKQAFLAAVREVLSEEALQQWRQEIGRIDYLAQETSHIIETPTAFQWLACE